MLKPEAINIMTTIVGHNVLSPGYEPSKVGIIISNIIPTTKMAIPANRISLDFFNFNYALIITS